MVFKDEDEKKVKMEFYKRYWRYSYCFYYRAIYLIFFCIRKF